MNDKFIYIKKSELKDLRKELWLKNDKKCPILGIEIDFDKTVIDHIHKRKDEEISENKGVIRDCIEYRTNALEGKFINAFKRYFGSDESKHPISFVQFLRNLADYIEKGALIKDGKYLVHPTEVPKEKKLSKRVFNKIAKLYKEEFPNRKELEYPKSGKITKQIRELAKKYGIEL